MEFTYKYKILKGSWGIHIVLKSILIDIEKFEGDVDGRVGNYCYAVSCSQISDEEKRTLSEGLKFGLGRVSNDHASDRVLVVNEILFNPCDFQIEGLFCAASGLIEKVFDLEMYKINTFFHRDQNKYVFDLPQV